MAQTERPESTDRNALERELKTMLPGPVTTELNGFADSDIYLSRSWLQAIHTYIRRQEGDIMHENRLLGVSQRRGLVACGNCLDLDVETLLEADPDEEVRLLYEALKEV